jgi:hypothetical protein
VFTPVSLYCNEGQTTTDPSLDLSRWRWNSPYPRVKHRRFHVVSPKTQTHSVVDNNGNVVGTERDEYVLDARGRFQQELPEGLRHREDHGEPPGPIPPGP